MPCVNLKNLVFLNSYDFNNPKVETVQNAVGDDYHNLSTDRRYFYMLLSNDQSFKHFNLTKIIPKKILSKIKKGQIDLVLDNSLEYFTSIIPCIYEDIVKKYEIDPAQIILITSVPNMEEYVTEYASKNSLREFKVEWIACFEEIGKRAIDMTKSDLLTATLPRRRFLNLNRRWRLHRPFIVALLKHYNLLDSGYISLGHSDDNVGWKEKYPELCNHYKYHNEVSNILEESFNLVHQPPMYLDNENLVTNRADHENSINQYYRSTDFSVITETTYHENIPFFSEKTFKAIAMQHPFILVTAPNSLKFLSDLGYKSFSPYINEEYDTILDHGDRMVAIVKEINRLCQLSESEFLKIKTEIDKIAEFNYNILKNKSLQVKRKNF